MIAMMRRAASCLGVVGICALLMHSAQNGNYARKELLREIGWWSLIGSGGLYLIAALLYFKKANVK